MNVPTDRILIVLILATALAVFAVGWGFLETDVGSRPLLQGGLVIAFLAVVVGSWFGFRRIDRKRNRSE